MRSGIDSLRSQISNSKFIEAESFRTFLKKSKKLEASLNFDFEIWLREE